MKKVLFSLAGDIVNRKSFVAFINTLLNVFKIHLLKKKDPYNTFEYLLNLSKKIGVKSRYYFIPGKLNEYDVRYDFSVKRTINIYNYLKQQQQIIGIHPSYNTFLNFDQLKKEKIRLVIRGEEGPIYCFQSAKEILPFSFDASFL